MGSTWSDKSVETPQPHTFMTNPDNQIPGDSKERVAFEMAKFIFEKILLFETAKEKPQDRKALLFKLYAECLGVVRQNAE